MGDVIIRHANYGLELVDELTLGPLVGPSLVTFTTLDPPLPGVAPTVFTVGRSRWVFEDLAQNVSFDIRADLYVGRVLATDGTELPEVPPSEDPGVLAEVRLKPRPGYPFPPTLTRVVGQVRLDPSVDPTEPPVANATVTITPMYGASAGTDFETFTDENGQYAVWFEPDPTLTPQWATGYTATAEAMVGVVLRSGSLSLQTLVLQTFNAAPKILLS